MSIISISNILVKYAYAGKKTSGMQTGIFLWTGA